MKMDAKTTLDESHGSTLHPFKDEQGGSFSLASMVYDEYDDFSTENLIMIFF
jgi:hypothetical protein